MYYVKKGNCAIKAKTTSVRLFHVVHEGLWSVTSIMSLRFKLVFFAPKTHTAEILSMLFKQCPNVLGKIGQYEECAFITPGVGESC
jgi:hypothetical protein